MEIVSIIDHPALQRRKLCYRILQNKRPVHALGTVPLIRQMKEFVKIFLCTHLALSQKIKSRVPYDAHDKRTAVCPDAVSPDSAREL